jgi:hypothetical protein
VRARAARVHHLDRRPVAGLGLQGTHGEDLVQRQLAVENLAGGEGVGRPQILRRDHLALDDGAVQVGTYSDSVLPMHLLGRFPFPREPCEPPRSAAKHGADSPRRLEERPDLIGRDLRLLLPGIADDFPGEFVHLRAGLFLPVAGQRLERLFDRFHEALRRVLGEVAVLRPLPRRAPRSCRKRRCPMRPPKSRPPS